MDRLYGQYPRKTRSLMSYNRDSATLSLGERKRQPTMGSQSDRDELVDDITMSLLRVINKIEQRRRVLRDYGAGVSMTLLEVEMCWLIFRNDGITGGELADKFGVTRSATSQIVVKLKAKGLVDEQPKPDDAKRKCLHVTARGQVAAKTAEDYRTAMGSALFPTASRAELKAYLRFVKNLEAYHAGVVDRWETSEGDSQDSPP
jgi:DNA-binding MarR family transcriptional regulator